VGLAHFFFGSESVCQAMRHSKDDIQKRLSGLDPAIDLVALEQPGNESLRLFIDHPDGVDLALCERVTKHLNHLLIDYSLEVSSPGPKHRRTSPSPEVKELS
jgi:ribosome maturation factor RimP